MKDFLFSVALGCAVGWIVMNICNLVTDAVVWFRDRADKKKHP